MAIQRRKEGSAVDTVFDFLFSVQQQKRNKPFRRPQPNKDGVYVSALVEIGTQPALFPLSSSLSAIDEYIEQETEMDLGGGVKAGLGSGIFTDTHGVVGKKISKNRAKSEFARIGGLLHYGIDGALLSLYAKRRGMTAGDAYKTGLLYADLKKVAAINKGDETNEILSLGVQEKGDDLLFARGVDLMTTTIAKQTPSLSKSFLQKIVQEGQQYDSRNERIKRTVDRLKLAGISDVKERNRIANMLWGKDSDEFGFYRIPKKERVDNVLSSSDYLGGGDEKVKKHNREVSDNRIKKILDSKDYASDRDKKIAIYKILRNQKGYNLDSKTAQKLSAELILPYNTGEQIAENAVYSSLVLEGREQSLLAGNYQAVRTMKDRISSLLNTPKDKTWGMRFARARIVKNWLDQSGRWSEDFVNGDWGKLGVDDLNFTKLVEEKKIKDENGKTVGKYMAPADTVVGKLVGRFYYFHPKNLVKGLFLDGDLLLKVASRGGVLDKKSFAYFLYTARPGAALSVVAKPLKDLSNNILGMINPLANSVKNLVKNFLTKLLGVAGIAGMLINWFLRIFGDKVTEAVSKLVIVVMLGLVGIIILLIDSFHSLFAINMSELYKEDITNPSRIVENIDVFTNEDFTPVE